MYTGQCCCYERFFGVFSRKVISCKFFCRFCICFVILKSYFCGFSFVDLLFIDRTTLFGDPARTFALFNRFFVVREVALESGGTTGQSIEADSGDVGVNRKETESKILELKRQKRARNIATTEVRHNVEKLCVLKDTANVEEIEKGIEVL